MARLLLCLIILSFCGTMEAGATQMSEATAAQAAEIKDQEGENPEIENSEAEVHARNTALAHERQAERQKNLTKWAKVAYGKCSGTHNRCRTKIT